MSQEGPAGLQTSLGRACASPSLPRSSEMPGRRAALYRASGPPDTAPCMRLLRRSRSSNRRSAARTTSLALPYRPVATARATSCSSSGVIDTFMVRRVLMNRKLGSPVLVSICGTGQTGEQVSGRPIAALARAESDIGFASPVPPGRAGEGRCVLRDSTRREAGPTRGYAVPVRTPVSKNRSTASSAARVSMPRSLSHASSNTVLR